MSTPFAFIGTLQLPADASLPQDEIPFNASMSFDSESSGVINLPSGSGSTTIPFGTIPSAGAKGVFLRYDNADNVIGAPPLQVTINSGSAPVELSLGGFLAYSSPTPVAGVTAIAIARTGAAKIRFWILG